MKSPSIMDDFKRDLSRAKYDESLKVILQVISKQAGALGDEVTDDERAALLAKRAELTKEEDGNVTFKFQFPENKTEEEVEARLRLLSQGLHVKREDGTFAEPQEGELWDNPDLIYKTSGTSVYFNRKIFKDAANLREGNAIWMMTSTPYVTDITGEINAVIMLSAEMPDWEASLNNLKKLAQARHYNEENMRDCLKRLSSHFEGYHASTFEGMTADQMAILLLRSQAKINKKLYYKQQLDKEKRSKSESILNAFTRAEGLIHKIYPGNINPEGKQRCGAPQHPFSCKN